MPDAEPVYPPGSTPPKATARIRKSLKAIHGANPSRPAGPLQHGLSKENWIVVDSLSQPSLYLSLLRRRQIEFRTQTRGDKTSVLVQLADLSLARELLERVPGEMRRSARRRGGVVRSRGSHREGRVLRFGAIGWGIGALIGCAINAAMGMPSWIGLAALLGAIAGAIWGEATESRR